MSVCVCISNFSTHNQHNTQKGVPTSSYGKTTRTARTERPAHALSSSVLLQVLFVDVCLFVCCSDIDISFLTQLIMEHLDHSKCPLTLSAVQTEANQSYCMSLLTLFLSLSLTHTHSHSDFPEKVGSKESRLTTLLRIAQNRVHSADLSAPDIRMCNTTQHNTTQQYSYKHNEIGKPRETEYDKVVETVDHLSSRQESTSVEEKTHVWEETLHGIVLLLCCIVLY